MTDPKMLTDEEKFTLIKYHCETLMKWVDSKMAKEGWKRSIAARIKELVDEIDPP